MLATVSENIKYGGIFHIYTGRSQNLLHFIPTWGSNWGIWVCQVRMSVVPTAVWVWRKTCIKHRTVWEDHGLIAFACMVAKNQNIPKLSPMADKRYTTSGTSLTHLWHFLNIWFATSWTTAPEVNFFMLIFNMAMKIGKKHILTWKLCKQRAYLSHEHCRLAFSCT